MSGNSVTPASEYKLYCFIGIIASLEFYGLGGLPFGAIRKSYELFTNIASLLSPSLIGPLAFLWSNDNS